MTLFETRTITIQRMSGSYNAGHWIAGNPTSIVMTGSVQASSGDKVETLMEGKRFSGSLDLFVDQPLVMADPKRGVQGDRYVDEKGDIWEVVLGNDWQNGIISHYEYTAVRIKELL